MCAAGRGSPARGLAETLRRLEALVGHEHISEDYVRFRIDLLTAQWAVWEALATRSPSAQPGAERGGRNGETHGPALDANAVPMDAALLARLCAALCDALNKPGRESVDASRLAAAAEKEPDLLAELARKAAFGPDQLYLDSLAQRLDVGAEALLFFGRTLAAPFVAEAARRLKTTAGRAAAARHASGHCTICGSPPALASLRRDDGRRILYCSLCGATGEFTRLACPNCGSRDREGLTFLRISQSDPRWIETCERCKAYIKTVDERRLPAGEEIIPVVEETATLHLDLLAEKEGYARRSPYAAVG
jgi:formate dehydrogenase accessory protein FdhE